MRRVSKTRRVVNAESNPVREQLADDFPICMLCQRRDSMDTHEITRGSSRGSTIGDRRCLLRLCRRCHNDVHASWSLAQQLCLKALVDLEYYDRVAVNVARGRAEDAISEREVWAELEWVTRQLRIA